MAGPIVTNDGMTPQDVEAYARQVEAQRGYRAGSLVAMLKQESRLGLNQQAHAASENSHATGIAQIQPGTAAMLARQGIPVDVHNGRQSIDGMAHLMDTALAGNGGNWDNATQQYWAGSQKGINAHPDGAAGYATAVASQLSLADAASQATYGAHNSAPPQASPPTATPSPTAPPPEKTVEQAASEATYGAHDSALPTETTPPPPSAPTDPDVELKAQMQNAVNVHRRAGETDVNAALGDVRSIATGLGYDPTQFTNLKANVQTGRLTYGSDFHPQKIIRNNLIDFGNQAAGAMQSVPAWLNSQAANADQAVPALGQLDSLFGMSADRFRGQAGIQNQIAQASQNSYPGWAGTLGGITGTALAAAPAVAPALAAAPAVLGEGLGGFITGQGGKTFIPKIISAATGGAFGGLVGGTVSGQDPKQSAIGGAVMGPLFRAAGAVGNKFLGPAFDTVSDAVGPTFARAGNAAGNAITSLTGRAVPSFDYTPSAEVQAQRLVAQRLAQDAAGGGRSPTDIQDHAASQPTKPLAIMDYGSNVQALTGRVFRSGGAGRQVIDSALTDRGGNAASRRVVADVGDAISNGGPTYTTAQALDAEQKATAAPLYAKAFEGGSTAPLETQFEGALQASGAKVAQAQQAANAAQNESTQAAAQVSQGGDNVYASSDALARQKAATAGLAQAQRDVATAQAEHAGNLDQLQKAQADGSANAPGAVWSPQIQRIIGNKFVKGGLQRGIDDQEAEAIADRVPHNPNEYSVTGTDANGEPIVSTVPNMRTLHAAKVGLDAQIGDETDVAGNVSSHGRVLIKLKNSLLEEMDGLNPDYAVARQAYSGSAASKNALKLGGRITTMPHAQFSDEYGQLSEADKALARQGAAEPIINQAMKPTANGMPPASLKDNDFVRRQLSPLFNNPADYDSFIGKIDAERQMAVTKNKVTGGSDTGDRVAQDSSALDQAGHVLDAVQSGAHAATGSPAGILNFANALRRFMPSNDSMSPQMGNILAQKLSSPINGSGQDLGAIYGNTPHPINYVIPPVLASGVNKLRSGSTGR